MIKKALLVLCKMIDKRQRLFPNGIKKVLKISDVKLTVNLLDNSSMSYMKSLEPCNKLYSLIQQDLHPEIILDVGANYGLISVVYHKYMPQAKIIAIEPDLRLLPYIYENFEQAKITDCQIYSALCGAECKSVATYSVNPSNSQDNRVFKEGWRQEKTYMVSIDTLINNIRPIFIKTDTQGYEAQVLLGGKHRLAYDNWIIKMEYAPYLLKQYINPQTFLEMLVKKYEVVDLSLIQYKIKSLDDLFIHKLEETDVVSFVNYIESLPCGWLDILIRPKKEII